MCIVIDKSPKKNVKQVKKENTTAVKGIRMHCASFPSPVEAPKKASKKTNKAKIEEACAKARAWNVNEKKKKE